MSSPARLDTTPGAARPPITGFDLAAGPAARASTLIDWHEGLPELRLETLTLREPRLSDAPSLFQHLATDEVARFMSRPPNEPVGFERFIAWLQSERRAARCFCFAIVPHREGRAVGLLQVRQLEPGFGSAEWGFALGQQHWGTGLFIASATATIDFVFRHTSAYRLEARASTENSRANGALAKLGAAPEGMLRQSLVGAARPMDQLLWSMHCEDWLAGHPRSTYQLLLPAARSPELPVPPRPADARIGEWRRRLPTYVSARGTLRDLELGDAEELLRQLSHPDVARYTPPCPGSVDAFEEFIRWAHGQRDAGKYACFGIVPTGGQRPVGIFQVRQLDPSFKTAEWGFMLGKACWGSGLFVTGAVHVLDFAFETVGVARVEARSATGNGRANGALRKLGATLEGQLRRSFLLGGVYHDDALWALLAEDWRRVRPQFLDI
jgi:RimJ/RimL family protein N-acetyltransferase